MHGRWRYVYYCPFQNVIYVEYECWDLNKYIFLEILEILSLLSRHFTQFLLMYAKHFSSTAYQYERIVIDG